jgi:SAM-dependent methyltransferase
MFIRFDPRRQRFSVDDTKISPASGLSTRWLLHALEETRPYAKGKLLDVGCGAKPYKEFFGAKEHIGIDWPNSLHRMDVEVFASGEALPFVDNSFDTVLCTELIEHLKDPQVAVQEMARVLKPGGYLILSAPFVHELHEQPFDFFRYTALGLCSVVERAGLLPVSIYPRGGVGTVLVDVSSRALLSSVRSVLRRFPGGRRIGNIVIFPLVKWPQALFSQIAIARTQKIWKAGSYNGLETPSRLSLGHVIVAQNPVEAI